VTHDVSLCRHAEVVTFTSHILSYLANAHSHRRFTANNVEIVSVSRSAGDEVLNSLCQRTLKPANCGSADSDDADADYCCRRGADAN
jgi:hypothetical protein